MARASGLVVQRALNGNVIRMGVRGGDTIVANLYSADRAIQREMKRVNKRFGKDVASLAAQLAPWDTGRLSRSYTYELSEKGLAVHIFADPRPFVRDGKSYYPWFVEFGTINSPAQPHLMPAFRAVLPHYRRDVRDAVRRAISRI